MMFANIKPVLIGIGAAVILGGLGYTKVYLPKVTYDSVLAKEGNLTENVNGVGTLEAKEIILLAPKSTSKIGALYVDEGDHVKRGAVLARMELSDLAGNKIESAALIDKSRSQMGSQKALIDDLTAKKELSDATLKRYRTLIKGGFVTQAELDGAEAQARSANALMVSAQENLAQSVHEVQRAEGSLSALNAKINDLSLSSPIDGIVVSREAEVGSTVGAGMAILRIANPKTVWVKAYIDERQSGLLRVGQKGFVTLRSTHKCKWPAIVSRIGVESDRITEERVVYLTLQETPEPLYLAEQAEVEIIIAKYTNALILPAEAIVYNEDNSGVWMSDNGKAVFHPVYVLGHNSDGNVAISGLEKGSRVILIGNRPLKAGDKVRL